MPCHLEVNFELSLTGRNHPSSLMYLFSCFLSSNRSLESNFMRLFGFIMAQHHRPFGCSPGLHPWARWASHNPPRLNPSWIRPLHMWNRSSEQPLPQPSYPTTVLPPLAIPPQLGNHQSVRHATLDLTSLTRLPQTPRNLLARSPSAMPRCDTQAVTPTLTGANDHSSRLDPHRPTQITWPRFK